MTLDIAIFGLSLSSSWGNGHATTYRSLVRALAQRGHRVTFIERDSPWYRDNRDLPAPDFCRLALYEGLADVAPRFGDLVATADLVVLGSYVPDGTALGEWITSRASGVTAFYDIDTPVTLQSLASDESGYISRALVPRFDLYLSFTGGPVLDIIENHYGSPRARPLYCSVDPDHHRPMPMSAPRWEMGYLGTYSPDRQPGLDRLLIEPARRLPDRRFVVAGPQYPETIDWPDNVERIAHIAPADHAAFYGAQRYTLNLTRAAMKAIGYSPSVRLFEAAACRSAIVSDRWAGMEEAFDPGREVLFADSADDVVSILTEQPEESRIALASAARNRALASHSGEARAKDLERLVGDVHRSRRARSGNGAEVTP